MRVTPPALITFGFIESGVAQFVFFEFVFLRTVFFDIDVVKFVSFGIVFFGNGFIRNREINRVIKSGFRIIKSGFPGESFNGK